MRIRVRKKQTKNDKLPGTGSAWRGDNCLPLLLPCRRDGYVAAGKAAGRAGGGDICVPDVGAVESERAWPIFSARVADRVHINTCETGKPQLWQSLLAQAPSSSSPAAASAPLHEGKKKKRRSPPRKEDPSPRVARVCCLCGGVTFTSSATNFARAGPWQCARRPRNTTLEPVAQSKFQV